MKHFEFRGKIYRDEDEESDSIPVYDAITKKFLGWIDREKTNDLWVQKQRLIRQRETQMAQYHDMSPQEMADKLYQLEHQKPKRKRRKFLGIIPLP